jgi:endonuclease III
MLEYSVDHILDIMQTMFPNAKAELDHHNPYQLTVAVILSAQATDVSVNLVTPTLFEKYPTVYDLAKADLNELQNIIKTIGLYRNKAKALIAMANKVVAHFNGDIPRKHADLLTLDGVGQKTANVIVSVAYSIPAIAVDTHVSRVSKRLMLAKEKDDVLTIERKLKRKIKRERWSQAHHLMIFFGRYHCKAINPNCSACPFTKQCRYYKEKRST